MGCGTFADYLTPIEDQGNQQAGYLTPVEEQGNQETDAGYPFSDVSNHNYFINDVIISKDRDQNIESYKVKFI